MSMHAALIILLLSNLIVSRPIDFDKVKDQSVIKWEVFRDENCKKKVTDHGQRQIDMSTEEMTALISRLEKDKTVRMPNIRQELERINCKYDTKQEAKNKLACEINTWENTITAQTGKLRTLNKAIYTMRTHNPSLVRRLKELGCTLDYQ